MMQALSRALGPMQRRIALMVGRAIVELIDDTPTLQRVQLSLLADEVRGDVERVQNYGFTSVPLPGAEAVAVSVGGSRDNLVVVAVDDRRFRLRGLVDGEAAIYTDEGDKIVLRRGGVIEITAATKVRVITPLVEMTGELHVTGNIVCDASVSAAVDVTGYRDVIAGRNAASTGNVTAGGNVTAAGDVADQGGAKTMGGMRITFNAHKHGTSPTPDRTM